MIQALIVVSVLAAAGVAVKFGSQLAGEPVKNKPSMGRYPLIEALIAVAMWASLVLLAGTGFLGATLPGHGLRGFTLLIHVGLGLLFAGSLALLAVFRAEAYTLAEPDTCGRFSVARKICFWLIAACGLSLIFSVLIAMFPVLGTHGQHMATLVHRCSALVALLATIIYAGAASKRA